jgi:anti-anti-sigma factor
MNLETSYSKDGKQLTIYLGDKFDYLVLDAFKLAYTPIKDDVTSVVINLKESTHMDSAALGMLLTMKLTLDSLAKSCKIINCQPPIQNVLQIARLEKTFLIE